MARKGTVAHVEERVDKLAETLAAMPALIVAQVLAAVNGDAYSLAGEEVPHATTVIPSAPTTVQSAPVVKVTARRSPVVSPVATPVQAEPVVVGPDVSRKYAERSKCFLGCRTGRGGESAPSTGLVDLEGNYWRSGADFVRAHAENGTKWTCVDASGSAVDAGGKRYVIGARAVLEATKKPRDGQTRGVRGAPALACGEETVQGFRLHPAPARRASHVEAVTMDPDRLARFRKFVDEVNTALAAQ